MLKKAGVLAGMFVGSWCLLAGVVAFVLVAVKAAARMVGLVMP